MKRRILCLLLAMVTVLGMLASCGSEEITDEDLDKETATRQAVSINMWVVTPDKISEETEALVEGAFNEFTKSRFTTYVDLIFVTENEYEDTLNAKFKAIEDAILAAEEEEKRLKEEARSLKAAGIVTTAATTVETEAETEEETIRNEDGIIELKYPLIKEDQVDIIYMAGYDFMKYLADLERLTPLDAEISSTGSSKALTDYISDLLIKNCKINGAVYGIPNNKVIGEYTYLLVNKELAAKYYIDPNSLTNVDGLLKVYDFMADVAENETEYLPSYGELEYPYIYFWNSELYTDDFSILAAEYRTTYEQTSAANPDLMPKNVFYIAGYIKHLLAMKKFEEAGYFDKAPKETDKYAVRILSGDSSVPAEFGEDYHVLTIKYPTATQSDIFGSFYGVSAYTGNLARSLEIITALNTEQELINILQYGVEDVHYTFNDDKLLTKLNNDYNMTLGTTGNIFMTYPTVDMDPDIWEIGKTQNGQAVLHPLFGFEDSWYGTEDEEGVDMDLMKDVETLSDSWAKKISDCKTYDELYTLLIGPIETETPAEGTDTPAAPEADIEGDKKSDLRLPSKFSTIGEASKALIADPIYSSSVKTVAGEGEDSVNSPCAIYYEWHEKYWPTPEV